MSEPEDVRRAVRLANVAIGLWAAGFLPNFLCLLMIDRATRRIWRSRQWPASASRTFTTQTITVATQCVSYVSIVQPTPTQEPHHA